MGRGRLTADEIRILSENEYVTKVTENRITYSNEFKLLFINEYFSGKTPSQIFIDAGFDVEILGTKRIERCSYRWREANASSCLGNKKENNNFYESRHINNVLELNKIINEQQAEIEKLRKKVEALEKKKCDL